MNFCNWTINQVAKTYGNIIDINAVYYMMIDLFNENISKDQFANKYQGGKQIYINYHKGMSNHTLPFSKADAKAEIKKILNYFSYQHTQNQFNPQTSSNIFLSSKYYDDSSYFDEEEEEDDDEKEEKFDKKTENKMGVKKKHETEEEEEEEEIEEEEEWEEEEESFDLKTNDSKSETLSDHEKDGKLHFYAINVGFGNLFILTIGIKAIIIDAGSSEITKEMELNNDKIPRSFIIPATTILKTKQVLMAIITHPTKDHFNLLKEILKNSSNNLNNIQVICGGYRDQYNDFALNENIKYSFDLTKLKKESILRRKQLFNTILNGIFFNEGVHFNFLIPSLINKNLIKNEDYNNLLLAVDYEGKRILITGNATQNTIDSLSKSDIKYLKNVDIFIVPNHGLNAKEGIDPLYIRSKFAILSSDPNLLQCYLDGCPNSDYVSELIKNFDSESPQHQIFVWAKGHTQDAKISDYPIEKKINVPLFSVSNNYFKYNSYCFNGIHLAISEEKDIEFEHTEFKVQNPNEFKLINLQ